MNSAKKYVRAVLVVFAAFLLGGTGHAADVTIGLQTKAGAAQKYKLLQDYLGKKGVSVAFQAAPDYKSMVDMFSNGSVDAMFSGSGVAGVSLIKGLGVPVVRPVTEEGISTYAAVIIAPRGSARFTGSPDYFDEKRVIFSAMASAGEIFFRSLGKSRPREVMKAVNHEAALDVLARGSADVAVVKNHVWNKEKGKYPQLEMVYEDKGQNPDGTLIVSRKLAAETARKLAAILEALRDDASADAEAVKHALKIREYIKTTDADFKHTVAMLRKAGVTKDFVFQF